MKRFLIATLLCAIGHCTYGADTDGDELLDLIDVAGFNANASGDVVFESRGIQDLDGANLLANATLLSLYNNQITSLESGDFQGLSNLQELDLSGNQIASLESGAFQGLSNLEALYLVLNRITSLESGDFEGLSNLQTLSLMANQITTIENGAFQGLSNLQTLALLNNQITSLENGDFQGLSNLQVLALGGNPIMELNLTGATFDSLRHISAGSGFGEITGLILDDAVLSLGSFEAIVGGTPYISNASLVGLRFSDRSPDDLSNLLTLENLDNVRVDQAFFDRYAAEFNAFDAISGNTVTLVPEPSAFFLCATASALAWLIHRGRLIRWAVEGPPTATIVSDPQGERA